MKLSTVAIRIAVQACMFAVVLLGFAPDVFAVYPTKGLLGSKNLLAGEGHATIGSFTYTASAIPAGTSLRVSFSKDGSMWYDSARTPLGWNSLSVGTNTIDLAGLSWSTSGFYYKIEYTGDGSTMPVLDDVRLAFTPLLTTYREYRTSGTLASANLLQGETVSGGIIDFTYNATAIPAGTSLKVRFSQDNSHWYSSAGVADAWDTLTTGVNSINLSGLGWTGANFYYQSLLTSNGSDTPVLDYVNVAFGRNALSGTVYGEDGTTPLGGQTVRVAINGVDHVTTAESDASTGAWSINDLTLAADDIVTVYLEDETADAVTVTVSSGSNLTDLNLRRNYLITRQDAGGALTNANLATAAVAGENDVSNIYTVASGSLTIQSGKSVIVPSGHILSPGGSVTVGGSFKNDGVLDLGGNAFGFTTGTAVSNSGVIRLRGTETFTNVTNLDTDSGTVVYAGDGDSSPDTFTIKDFGDVDYYNLTINALDGSADTFVAESSVAVNKLTVTSGKLTIDAGQTLATIGAGATLSIGAGTTVTNNGTLSLSGTTFTSAGTLTSGAGSTIAYAGQSNDADVSLLDLSYQNLSLNNAGTTFNVPGSLTISVNLTNTAGTLSLAGHALSVSGTFQNVGTLKLTGDQSVTTPVNAPGSTVEYSATSGTRAIKDWAYKSLTINGAGGTFTLAANTSVSENLAISAGRLEQGSNTLNVGGNLAIASGVAFAKSPTGSSLTLDGSGTITDGNVAKQDLGAVVIAGSSTTRTLGSSVTLTSLTINAGETFDLAGHNFNFSVPATVNNNGTFRLQGVETLTNFTNDPDSGTTQYNGTTALTIQNLSPYYQLTFSGSGGSWNIPSDAVVNGDLNIQVGIFDLSGHNISLASSSAFTNAGTLRLIGTETATNLQNDVDSGTIEYDGTGTHSGLVLGYNYYHLTFSGAGGTWQISANLSTNGNLTLQAGTLDLNGHDVFVKGSVLRSGGTLANTGGRTLTLDGVDQSANPGDVTWERVRIDGSSGTVTLNSSMSATELLEVATDRTFALGDYIFTVLGSFVNYGRLTHNAGYISYPSSDFHITDENFDTAPTVSLGVNKIYVTVSDISANTDGITTDTVAVTVSCPHDEETVTLRETGNMTGVFRNSGLSTALHTGSATNNDGTLACADNETITAHYVDPWDNSDTASTTALATGEVKPNAPSAFAGTGESKTSIRWTWADNSDNERGFRLYNESSQLIATIGTPNTTSYTETGLTKGTSYIRKAVAYNNAGNSIFSSAVSVTTPKEPVVPSNLSGTASSSTSILWTWTDNSNNETGFKLLNGSGQLVATINREDATSYTETGLTKGTSYIRKLVAFNIDGDSPMTIAATVTTHLSSPSIPTFAAPDDYLLLKTLQPTFTFGMASDEDGIKTYELIIDPRSRKPEVFSFAALGSYAKQDTSSAVISSDLSMISVTPKTPLAEGRHEWQIKAVDGVDDYSYSDIRTFTIDISKPTITNVTVTSPAVSSAADLTTTAQAPTLGFVLSDTTGLSSTVFRIEKPIYILGTETGRKLVYEKRLALAGTKEGISVRPTSIFPFGTYYLTVTVTDTAGNVTTIERTLDVVSGEALRSQAEDNTVPATKQTLAGIQKTVEQGKTPTKTPVEFQLPDLAKQAVVRNYKQAANLDAYLKRLLPLKTVANINGALGQWEVNIGHLGKDLLQGTGSKIAGLFKSFDERQRELAKSGRVIPVAYVKTEDLLGGIANTSGNCLQKLVLALRAGRQNRLALAVQAEQRMGRTMRPILIGKERIVTAGLVAFDAITGRHEQALAISDVVVDLTDAKTANVNFKTNRSTQGKINYGTTGTYGKEAVFKDLRRERTVSLDKLDPKTKYYFEIVVSDINGKQTYDAYYTFTTPSR